MPSAFLLALRGKGLVAFPEAWREPPGELRTAIVRQILTIEYCGGRKNGETTLDSRDADDLHLSGDIDGATRVGASGVWQHPRHNHGPARSGRRQCKGDRYR